MASGGEGRPWCPRRSGWRSVLLVSDGPHNDPTQETTGVEVSLSTGDLVGPQSSWQYVVGDRRSFENPEMTRRAKLESLRYRIHGHRIEQAGRGSRRVGRGRHCNWDGGRVIVGVVAQALHKAKAVDVIAWAGGAGATLGVMIVVWNRLLYPG